MFKNYPKSVYICALMQALIYFNGFGMVASLSIFLITQHQFSEQSAYNFFSLFLVLLYTMPLVGGQIADKYIGPKATLVYGTFFLLLSFLLLGLSDYYLVGILILAVGIGFFKSSNAALVGVIYRNHPLKDKENGFTLFYATINIGALFGPVCYGIISSQLGWSYVFILGITVTIIMLACMPYLLKKIPKGTISQQSAKNHAILLLLCGCLLYVLTYAPSHVSLFLSLIWISAGLLCFYIFAKAFKDINQSKANLFLILLLNSFLMIFFMSEFQIGALIPIFIENHINRTVLGLEIPTSAFASILALSVVVSMPIINHYAGKFKQNKVHVRFISRSILGFSLTAVAFSLFLLLAQALNVSSTQAGLFILIIAIFILGIAECLIIPPSQATTTALVSSTHYGTFIGMTYLFMSFGGILAGKIAASTQHISAIMLPYISLSRFSVGYIVIISISIVTILFGFFYLKHFNFNQNKLKYIKK